jgi:carboxypeptidase C (cathepsin A)
MSQPAGALPTKVYSGYLNIPGGKHLHYIFTEATAVDPKTAPVQLWFNGGPGCSSMEGFLNELGIFHITPGTGELYVNPYRYVAST